jgi:hypothetical protein
LNGNGVEGAVRRVQAYAVEILEDLAVALIDAAKAAEFALRSIPVAVMVSVFGGELAL